MTHDQLSIPLTARPSYGLSSSTLSSFFHPSEKSTPSLTFGINCFELLCAPLSLEKIVLVLHNAFDCCHETLSFEDELTLFFYSYSLYITTADLLHYLFYNYIPGVVNCKRDRIIKLQPSLPAFIRCFLSSWLNVDPRLHSHSQNIISYIMTNQNGLSLHAFTELLSRLLEYNITPSDTPKLLLTALAIDERTQYHQMFFKTSPYQAAAYLQAAHLEIYRKVWPWDLIAFSSGSASSESKRLITAVPDHFNYTVAWIQTSCLKPKSARSRVKKIVQWIAIAEAAVQLNFLPVILMIISALNHPVVTRLKQTWELLPPASLDVFQSLLSLSSVQNNYQPLRKQAQQSKSPLPLAILSKDLTILLEILRSPSKSIHLEEIPYRDLRQIATAIYRAYLPSVNPTPELIYSRDLISFLHDPLPRLLIDRLYQLSYAHEAPPQRLDPEVVVTNPLLHVRK